MPVSKVAAATCAFVAVLLALARSYEVALTVNRDSRPEELLKAYSSAPANTPALAGADEYDKQVPLSSSIPLRGGVSQDGFAAVLWHLDGKRTNKGDWSQTVRDGKLTAALRALNPKKKRGQWTILCDHEGSLRAKISMEAYRTRSIGLWSVPPKSPDLNPVEMFWGWLRKKLRSMDLEDMRKKRRLLGKTACTARVKGVLKSAKAQTVAKNVTGSFRKSCKQVVDRNGAAADN